MNKEGHIYNRWRGVESYKLRILLSYPRLLPEWNRSRRWALLYPSFGFRVLEISVGARCFEREKKRKEKRRGERSAVQTGP